MADYETLQVHELSVPQHAGQRVKVRGQLVGRELGEPTDHVGELTSTVQAGGLTVVGLSMTDAHRAVLCHPMALAGLEAPATPATPSVSLALRAMDLCRPEIGRRVRVHGYRLRSTGHDFDGRGEHEGELVSVTRLDDPRAVVVLDDRRDGVRVVSCGLHGSVFVLRSTPAEVPAPLRLAWRTRRSHAKLTGSGDVDHCAVLAQAMQDAGYEFARAGWRQEARGGDQEALAAEERLWFEDALRASFEAAKHGSTGVVEVLIDLADKTGVAL